MGNLAIVLRYNAQSPTIKTTRTPDRFTVYPQHCILSMEYLAALELSSPYIHKFTIEYESADRISLSLHFSVKPLCLGWKWLMHEEKLIYVKRNVTAHKPEIFVTISTPPENEGYRTLCYFTVGNEAVQFIYS